MQPLLCSDIWVDQGLSGVLKQMHFRVCAILGVNHYICGPVFMWMCICVPFGHFFLIVDTLCFRVNYPADPLTAALTVLSLLCPPDVYDKVSVSFGVCVNCFLFLFEPTHSHLFSLNKEN